MQNGFTNGITKFILLPDKVLLYNETVNGNVQSCCQVYNI